MSERSVNVAPGGGRRPRMVGDSGVPAHRPSRRHPMRASASLALFAPMVLLMGCYYTVTNVPLPAAERSAAAPPRPQPYLLQDGDQITVRFYQNQDLDEDLVIRPDGKVSLQLIGDIQAAGLEPTVLAKNIEGAFASELARPRVVVLVRAIGARVYVGGEVGKPGAIPYFANLTLVQAVQEAGGFNDSAHLSQVVLIRRGPDGHPIGRAIDVRPVIGGTDPGDDVPLRPFDIAFVPRSKIADVDVFVKQYIRDALPINPGNFLFLAY